MISAFSFIDHLRGLGYSQYAGVPCSFLTSLINYVIGDPTVDYIGATSEGEAVGITFGAFLAGRKTVTMCQNSGLGNMVNPLTSLNYPFRVPTLLIVTWRGQPEVRDEPQHEQMGRIMQRLLETMEIPYLPFPAGETEIAQTLAEAEASMQERKRPFALVMQRGSVAPQALSGRLEPSRSKPICDKTSQQRRVSNSRGPLQLSLFSKLSPATKRSLLRLARLAANSSQSRIAPTTSMSSAGWGPHQRLVSVWHTRCPRQPVVVIDGDGAALMKLGVLATIGFYQPSNFLHIILDNQAHDSTGGQQTVSEIVRFAAIAGAANYRSAFAVDRPKDIREAVRLLRYRRGPSLLHVKIRSGSPEKLGRPTVPPHEVKERFSQFLRSNAK